VYLAIDNRRLVRQPHQIEIVPAEHDATLTADGRPQVRPGGEYVTINCTWGESFTYQDVLGELDRLRANRGIHALTFEPSRGCRYLTVNAFMGKAALTHVGYTSGNQIAMSAFTIPFVQVDTPTFLYPMRWTIRNTIAVASPHASHVAPAAGRIIAVDGYIRNVGAGAGQTRVQISNGATDYLSTPGDFLVTGDHEMTNQVLAANTDFADGNQIDLDVTAIPAGGLSTGLLVTAWCLIFRP
jgi:hypothetical protein